MGLLMPDDLPDVTGHRGTLFFMSFLFKKFYNIRKKIIISQKIIDRFPVTSQIKFQPIICFFFLISKIFCQWQTRIFNDDVGGESVYLDFEII